MHGFYSRAVERIALKAWLTRGTTALVLVLFASLMRRALNPRFNNEFPTFWRLVQKINFSTVITLFQMLVNVIPTFTAVFQRLLNKISTIITRLQMLVNEISTLVAVFQRLLNKISTIISRLQMLVNEILTVIAVFQRFINKISTLISCLHIGCICL